MKPGPFSTRQVVLFGARGQLGAALLARLPRERVRTFAWQELKDLSDKALQDLFRSSQASDFVFANGVTDPRLSEELIRFSNIEFPCRVIAASNGTSDGCPHRYLTFGTIQENFPDVCRSNAYLKSKLDLFNKMESFQALPGAKSRFLHFRIHTLYGSELKRHMFLGQMAEAIQKRSGFAMSSGEQLREYHHVDDAAASAAAVLAREWDFGPFVELNSGTPLRLADLARRVFREMKSEDLLKVGTVARHSAENTEKVFARSPEWLLGSSRDPIEGILAALKEWMEKSPR